MFSKHALHLGGFYWPMAPNFLYMVTLHRLDIIRLFFLLSPSLHFFNCQFMSYLCLWEHIELPGRAEDAVELTQYFKLYKETFQRN